MKKKVLLLIILLLTMVPLYNIKAITLAPTTVEVEYVNMDNLYLEETYISYDDNEKYTSSINENTGTTTYVIYGDTYEIKNKKITGLNNYCKYKECYNDIIAKYVIIKNLEDAEVAKVSSPLDLIDFSYRPIYRTSLKKIETATESEYTYRGVIIKPIDGEQLLKSTKYENNDLDDSLHEVKPRLISEQKININYDEIININYDEIIKEIPGYKYISSKIYNVSNNGEYIEKDSINRDHTKYILRLYYKKEKQESTETVNKSQVKTIKMKDYFKDLETPAATISYRVLDTSIAEVNSEGNITPLKVGETDIIATADGIEYTLHLRVTEDMIANPDTASPIIMILCVIGILISGTTIYLKDQTN